MNTDAAWRQQSLDAFLQATASSAPAPGGGGVAALTAASAAALLEMVANLTLHKAGYEDAQAVMADILTGTAIATGMSGRDCRGRRRFSAGHTGGAVAQGYAAARDAGAASLSGGGARAVPIGKKDVYLVGIGCTSCKMGE